MTSDGIQCGKHKSGLTAWIPAMFICHLPIKMLIFPHSAQNWIHVFVLKKVLNGDSSMRADESRIIFVNPESELHAPNELSLIILLFFHQNMCSQPCKNLLRRIHCIHKSWSAFLWQRRRAAPVSSFWWFLGSGARVCESRLKLQK